MTIYDDVAAWNKFPQYRIWFNKLWLSERLGYLCGPGGVPVPEKNQYIVRPIYNLRGMGAGAKIQELDPNDLTTVPPGYFWCEIFTGNQYSIDISWEYYNWKITSCYQGITDSDNLYKFKKWVRSTTDFKIPEFLDLLQLCKNINIEIIGNKIIEVHLRSSPDPSCSEIIPVWEGDEIQVPDGYTWISSPVDADGFISQSRLGFFVK